MIRPAARQNCANNPDARHNYAKRVDVEVDVEAFFTGRFELRSIFYRKNDGKNELAPRWEFLGGATYPVSLTDGGG